MIYPVLVLFDKPDTICLFGKFILVGVVGTGKVSFYHNSVLVGRRKRFDHTSVNITKFLMLGIRAVPLPMLVSPHIVLEIYSTFEAI